MTLIGCFVTPHPPIIIPEVGGAQLAEAQATVQAMRSFGRGRRPSTRRHRAPVPHAPWPPGRWGLAGIVVPGEPCLLPGAACDRSSRRRPSPRPGDHRWSEAARSARPGHRGAGGDGGTRPWFHGPLGLSARRTPAALPACAAFILHARHREHVRFGNAVGEALEATSQRVVYVASADLSHRLLPGAPVGFDPRGVQFDRLVADAFAAGDWEGLLSIDPETTAAAGSVATAHWPFSLGWWRLQERRDRQSATVFSRMKVLLA